VSARTRREPVASIQPAVVRCAIYTRVSTDEGLGQDFNSLHNQREACEPYVASQRANGWELILDHYDDGGFSGATMDRPALKRLLADVEAGKIQRIVVYKMDRLTRSLMDFSRLADLLERHAASIVSVTQQFDTGNSMGRLTLNMLLSFAHYAEPGVMRSPGVVNATWAPSALAFGAVAPPGRTT